MIELVERSDSRTLGTLDHFSHLKLKGFGQAFSGATQSLVRLARILYSKIPLEDPISHSTTE